MPRDPDNYDFFVSYARADNVGGWVESFLEALVAQHAAFTGGRELSYFFDRRHIDNFADWESQIFHKGLARSRLFVAFLSPRYFGSPVCRKEWKAWIDQEIAQHILSDGSAPIYFVEVPGLFSKPMLGEREVARGVAELCGLADSLDELTADLVPVLRESRRRQLICWIEENAVQPFYQAGVMDLQREDLRQVLRRLAEDLEKRTNDARRAADSPTTVPPYNRNFTGRLEELLDLRRRLKHDRAGVICGIAGLGGIGKTELAFTFAHAYGGVYPGGRFYVPCEYAANLRDAALVLGDWFRDQIGDDERMQPDSHFKAIVRCLRQRLDQHGSILLVWDNVTDAAFVSREQTDALTVLGPDLHLLATTRLLPPTAANWLTLGELSEAEGLELLDKHRPFVGADRDAARRIVQRLAGFALAVELVGAYLAAHKSATYTGLADGLGLGLEDLEVMAEDQDAKLRRHNHERRLQAVLGPTLAGLTEAERLAVQYAACLAPDHVPLPWLRELVVEQFPELAQPNRLGDPWQELCDRLLRLTIFTRADGEGHHPRIVRVHRLVQDLVRRELSPTDLATREKAVDSLVVQRDAVLRQTTR